MTRLFTRQTVGITAALAGLAVLTLVQVTPVGAEKKADRPDQIVVKARLVEIPGNMPPDDLYDYAFVMKYEVQQGGGLEGKAIYVAHYKPRLRRSKIKDAMKKYVGGKLKKFREGDVHQLELTSALQQIWEGATVDEFFATDRKATRYWCLKVDAVK